MGEGAEQIDRIYRKEEVTFLNASIRQNNSHQLYWFPKTACAQKGLLCSRICKALLEGSYCPGSASLSVIPVFQVFPWEEETVTTQHLAGPAGSWAESCPHWVTLPFVVSSLYLVEQLHWEPVVSYIFSLAQAPLGVRHSGVQSPPRALPSCCPESPVIGEAAPDH